MPASGRLVTSSGERLAAKRAEDAPEWTLPASMVCNMSAALIDVAVAELGIACLPDFMVRQAIARGELVALLDAHVEHQGTFRLLWPSSKHLAPKLRVFIDFMVEALFAEKAGAQEKARS